MSFGTQGLASKSRPKRRSAYWAGTIDSKPQAGDLILSPLTAIHEGSGWCAWGGESLIKDPQHREVLFDLENLRVSMRATFGHQSTECLTLDKTMANLLRL